MQYKKSSNKPLLILSTLSASFGKERDRRKYRAKELDEVIINKIKLISTLRLGKYN